MVKLGLVIGLTEFKVTVPHSRYMRAALQFGFHLVYSHSDSENQGVAFLVSTNICHQSPPDLKHIIRGRVASVRLTLHPSQEVPPTDIFVVYGSNVNTERRSIQTALTPYLNTNSIFVGDWNGTTRVSDYKGASSGSNIWPWLKDVENLGLILDSARVLQDLPPHTRVRGYGTSSSYIDKIYMSRKVSSHFSPCTLHIPDFSDLPGSSDHDPISVTFHPWGNSFNPGPRCHHWKKKHITLFQETLNLVDTPQEGLSTSQKVKALEKELQAAMDLVNRKLPVRKRLPRQFSPWPEMISRLRLLAKRRGRSFYKRVRSSFLTPLACPRMPIPGRGIKRILQANYPWDPLLLDQVPTSPVSPDPPLPELSDLQRILKIPRTKASAGLPGFLYFTMPIIWLTFLLTLLHEIIKAGEVPPHVLSSETVNFFKNKGDWRDPKRWRAIALSHALYRLIAKWIYSHLYDQLIPFITYQQHGGMRGKSPSMCTILLMHHISLLENPSDDSLVSLDIYHAFDSPPKDFMLKLLGKRGVSPVLMTLLLSILKDSSTFFRGCPGILPFQTTHGIKQGCPLSALLWITFFQLFLDHLKDMGIPFGAFIDDTSFIVKTSLVQIILEELVLFGLRMGIQFNMEKTEVMPLGNQPLPSIKIRTNPLLPKMVVSNGVFGSGTKPFHPPPSPPIFQSPTIVDKTLHLGHLLTSDLSPETSFESMMKEFDVQLASLNANPIPPIERVMVLQSIVAPSILYRLETTPVSERNLLLMSDKLVNFALAVKGLPVGITDKTLFSNRRCGIGIPYLPTLQPTRLLDSLQKAHSLHEFPLSEHSTAPYTLFKGVRESLLKLPAIKAPLPSVGFFPSSMHHIQPSEHPLGFMVYEGKLDLPTPLDNHYSDGSLRASRAGLATISPTGEFILARTPGLQTIYRSELLGATVTIYKAADGETVCVDNQGVVKVLNHTNPVLREAHWVEVARGLLKEKRITVEWVKGHSDSLGNNKVDLLAKTATDLPLQGPEHITSPWQVRVMGQIFSPPHKVWTSLATPTHSHQDIHRFSWDPLRCNILKWYKWLFGLQWRPGFMSYQSYWTNIPSKRTCPTCGNSHNSSIHGFISFCSPAHPLVAAWEMAWGTNTLVKAWRRSATHRDRFLLGKLVIPISLWNHLKVHLGKKDARRAVKSFQIKVLPLQMTALQDDQPPPEGWDALPADPQRPSVFNEEEWDDQTGPRQVHQVRKRKR
jgi:hypothetical protein